MPCWRHCPPRQPHFMSSVIINRFLILYYWYDLHWALSPFHRFLPRLLSYLTELGLSESQFAQAHLGRRVLYSACHLNGTGGVLAGASGPVIDCLRELLVRRVCLATLQWSANMDPRGETGPSAAPCNPTWMVETVEALAVSVHADWQSLPWEICHSFGGKSVTGCLLQIFFLFFFFKFSLHSKHVKNTRIKSMKTSDNKFWLHPATLQNPKVIYEDIIYRLQTWCTLRLSA